MTATSRWRRLLQAIRRAKHRTGALNVHHGQHLGAERVHSYWHGWWSARRGLPRELSVFDGARHHGCNLWIVDWLAGWDDGAAGRAAVPPLLRPATEVGQRGPADGQHGREAAPACIGRTFGNESDALPCDVAECPACKPRRGRP